MFYGTSTTDCAYVPPYPQTDQGLRDPGHLYYPKCKLPQDVPSPVCRAAFAAVRADLEKRLRDGYVQTSDVTP